MNSTCPAVGWFQRALEDLDPARLVREHMADPAGEITVCALGKAAAPMWHGWWQAASLRGVHPEHVRALISAPQPVLLPAGVRGQSFLGGHPLPNAASLQAAAAMLDAARELAAGPKPATLVALISGGGSAMAELPLLGGLAELQAWYQTLVHSGSSIAEINRRRIERSAFKGGKLAAAAHAPGVSVQSLILSDVPGDDPALVASGPTFPGSQPHLLAGNRDLCAAVAGYARDDGFDPVVADHTADEWEESAAAEYLLVRWRALTASHSRPCLIAGGEVRAQVPVGTPGRGGRNSHLALRVALAIAGEPSAFLSVGSDGVDGSSDAAGACVDGSTAARVRAAAAIPELCLRDFDAHRALDAAGALIRTGHTGNNLRDLRVFLPPSLAPAAL